MTDIPIAPDGEPVVYFIGWCGQDVKIGFTRHLAARLTELIKRTGCPQKLLASTPGSFASERSYHARFADDRKHGEWFNWSAGIEAEIARLNGEAAHG
ncbi:GIY-YIG nuclease family protein [Sphingobium sp. CR2-8]|uniref:GIY-YIG nuclease family protein n=1 Tax=Sphingobium sp. CR2-8 TaxID=1306534 RepID=UPI002DB98675|nr:GIY-YIG nuclease family protein [Sphingobium sp. CR2-8]MEC3912215.1 GIY-YIG nuclease family protein [Sphingobium sp. CR2-8]